MKPTKTYLKGQSVFIISIIVILLTIATVYINGENQNRSIISNFYISLIIIGTVLFLFMTYGLYKGVKLIDNFPKFKSYKIGKDIYGSNSFTELPSLDAGDGVVGIIMSIILWVVISILTIVLLIILEFALWFTIFIIIMMLYWLFFRALKLVFKKVNVTRGDIGLSALYAVSYTILYLGWIFAIIFISNKF